MNPATHSRARRFRAARAAAAVAALAFLFLAAAAARAPRPLPAAPPRIVLAPCRLEDWTEDVLCGTHEVFENRVTKRGRKISLRIVVLPARDAAHRVEPVFYLAGGPGGSAVDTVARAGATYLEKLRRTHDLVFVDQRGTGGSNGLPCDLTASATSMAGTFADPFPVDRIRDCAKQLQEKADLTCYSTEFAMADLDEVRAGLGYERINLYGGSYGSRAALVYIRMFGAHVRSATLLGVAPPEAKYPLPISKGFENAMRILDRDAAADENCRKEGFAPLADLRATVALLERGPVVVETVNPQTRDAETVTVSRDVFVDLVRVMLYRPDSSRWLPYLLHHTKSGDFRVFAVVAFQSASGIEAQIARGMHLCVFCAEDVDAIREEDGRRDTAGQIFGDARWRAMQRACTVWPHGRASGAGSRPVESNVPVLLVAGEADPVTPPWLAQSAATSLPNGRVVVVPHAGHAFDDDCVEGLVATFIERGSVAGLDVTCVAGIARVPFVTEQMLRSAYPGRSESAVPAGTEQAAWNGTIEIGGAKLRLVLRVRTGENGKLSAVVDSPDQGATDLPVETLTIEGGVLRFEMRLIGASYEGKLDAAGSVATGEWKQAGRTFPLVFTKTPAKP